MGEGNFNDSAVTDPVLASGGGAQEDPRMADPVFAVLARPTLPTQLKRNRAWLQIQSPQRVFFYWSVESNPYQTMQKAFGPSASNYTFVLKLINLTKGWEELHHVESEGDWWFAAEPNCRYRAEVGFHAANRPYVRVLFSNEVETPREGPSSRPASESEWAISAERFGRVLDRSGYGDDGYGIEFAHSDLVLVRERARLALGQLLGCEVEVDAFSPEEICFLLLELAAGKTLEQIRGRVSEALYEFVKARGGSVSARKALEALQANFELVEKRLFGLSKKSRTVHGASMVHFPRRKGPQRRTLIPRRLVADV